MAKTPKRHLKAVASTITDEQLEALMSEDTDEEFGEPQLKDSKPVKLKDWKAEDFASIYVRFRPHLERHARKYLNNSGQIDEVVQDAFLYLMVSLPELDSEIGVLRFLKWKVKNLCIDIYRAQGKAYVNSLEDIAEPQSNDIEHDELLEQADDAAIVKLALSKLNPRHREVLVAQIYEEKTIEEIAMQINLSENATRQLTFRARAAFKKALLGDVDTEGMSIAGILSVAAKKAAHEAKKTGVQAMALLLFLAIAATTFFTNTPSQNTVAEAPANNSGNSTNEAVTPETPVIKTVSYTPKVRKEVELVPDFYEENPVDAYAAAQVVDANKEANIIVYRASRDAGSAFRLEAAEGLVADFIYDTSADPVIKDLTFTIMIKGIQYNAYARFMQIKVDGNHISLTAQLTDLIDLNGLVYGQNALSRAWVAMDFTLEGNSANGTLSIK